MVMGLVIATFIPDGIVFCSDSMSQIKNNDDGFIQSEQEKIFVFGDKFVIAIEGNGFYKGLPVSSYLNTYHSHNLEGMDVKAFAEFMLSEFLRIFPNEPYVAYIAGYDCVNSLPKPVVYLLHNGGLSCINEDPDGNPVYNYHAIGRTHWVNKLMQHTQANIGESLVKFQAYDVDFSKYSILKAKEFGLKLLDISETMDSFSQLMPMLGGKKQYAILRPYAAAEYSFE